MDNKFRFFKPLPYKLGNGFQLPDQTKYFYDRYGGWQDEDFWYDSDSVCQGRINGEGIFEPNWTKEKGEEYKSGPDGVKMIKKNIQSIQTKDADNQIYKVNIIGFPMQYQAEDYIKYIIFECDLKQDQILECKKTSDENTKGDVCFSLIKGYTAVMQCLLIEGRVLYLLRDGIYEAYILSIYITKNNDQQDLPRIENQVKQNISRVIVYFANLPEEISKEDAITEIAMAAQVDKQLILDLIRSAQIERGKLIVNNQDIALKLTNSTVVLKGKKLLLRI